ncbi:MAG: zinc ribbon domain-containing protein [Pseudomonadota bacterium]
MHCRNCGAELRPTDELCSACGQGVAEGQDRSFAHLVRASLEEVTSVFSRLWRSIRALMFSPGVLSRDFRDGRRRRFLSPIGLFLLGNLLYFLAPPLSDLQLSLEDQYELQPYRVLITGWVDNYIAQSGQTFGEVARLYELRIAELAKVMVILMVPLVALVTQLLFFDRRLYYADHVVIALHYLAFVLIYLIATSAMLGVLYWVLPGGVSANLPRLVPVVLCGVLIYAAPMLKRAMDVSWWRAILFTPLFVVGFFIAHLTYRLLQFTIGFTLVTIT